MTTEEIREILKGKTLHRVVDDYVVKDYIQNRKNCAFSYLVVLTPSCKEMKLLLPVTQIERLCRGEQIDLYDPIADGSGCVSYKLTETR